MSSGDNEKSPACRMTEEEQRLLMLQVRSDRAHARAAPINQQERENVFVVEMAHSEYELWPMMLFKLIRQCLKGGVEPEVVVFHSNSHGLIMTAYCAEEDTIDES